MKTKRVITVQRAGRTPLESRPRGWRRFCMQIHRKKGVHLKVQLAGQTLNILITINKERTVSRRWSCSGVEEGEEE